MVKDKHGRVWKAGDRVWTKGRHGMGCVDPCMGVIETATSETSIGVRMDRQHNGMHDLTGDALLGHGWFFSMENLENLGHLDPSKLDEVKPISIPPTFDYMKALNL